MSDEDALTWAKQEAAKLRVRSTTGTVGLAIAAIEFLRVHAGRNSVFAIEAAKQLERSDVPVDEVRTTLADILESWVDYAQSAALGQGSLEVRARIEASTDILEQVQNLLADAAVHNAAPTVLAGAALEELLRSLLEKHGVSVVGKPGIASYAEALRAVDVLTRQDVKDITAWAGLRNDAAHGDFTNLSSERVRLMVDGINLFMRKYSS
jgi:hypothetical protein